jgi:hypothetical protein
MPLYFFILSLRRLLLASFFLAEQRALRYPSFSTARGRSNKYSHHIPGILALVEHCREPDMDEALIWYTFNHEELKGTEDSQDVHGE